ncbi:MAG: hypothetical protein B9S32_13170 [Verrucomicrobia bacterium Tous-C9LFEB]|nr:MAG: hypothetical protein B9S32_13170 [Verrucomicrobia bacterium Tous-C9LFEB]
MNIIKQSAALSTERSTPPDGRTRRDLLPVRLVWQSPRPCQPIKARRLLEPSSNQVHLEKIKCCRMSKRGSAILLDFGKELYGGIQIVSRSESAEPTKIRIRFGESVSEAMSDPVNDHGVHDVTANLPQYSSYEFGSTGFRFVRVDLLSDAASLNLLSIRAISLLHELPWRGSFESSDARLNQIWATGARTVQLCLQDYLWDGIKRDRLVWAGDLHPEICVTNAVFGEVPLVAHTLDFIRDITPAPRWMNGFSSYSLWWLLCQRDWFLYHGNKSYLKSQRDYLEDLLPQILAHVGKDGAERLPETRFIDWASHADEKAKHAGLHGLLTWACAAGAELASHLRLSPLERACAAAVTKLKRHQPELTSFKQSEALLVLAGIRSSKWTNQNVLSVNPTRDLSPFMGYYILQARARAGDIQGALNLVREYWGGMLDRGATSFWEAFDLEWLRHSGRIDQLTQTGKKDIHGDFGQYCYQGFRHSLCHGWSAGPTAWLSEEVLGFLPLQPGSRVLRLNPQIGSLRYVEGSFPTPYGDVKVKHSRTASGVKTVFHAPSEVRVIQNQK